MLDNFYITIFNHYKKSLGKRSLIVALLYINLLESAITLALGAFILAFASQMKMTTMSLTKFWVIFVLVAVCISFKNWMRFNGRKRNILNAKLKPKPMSIQLLWLLPIGGFLIGLILLQVQ
ncbi:hypothetical protein [uncultured Winogradskyella sp.]|uniref:hypothetical protein n=1 Tax=uncultured Winogradskyella sp. TaxID=395353 RepID=UPI0030D837B2|tara:strand:+ start:190767 stop:191129 length:363 start_codon:yes stop_codon:yes gene_type:complete